MRPYLLAALLLAAPLAGCLDLFNDEPTFRDHLSDYGFEAPADLAPDRPLRADELDWPDFSGATIHILDHGAFPAFDDAAARFEQLTGAKVIHTEADDTGSALDRAIQGRGDPEFDILYGIDNMLLHRAMGSPTRDQIARGDLNGSVFAPYTPQLAARVPAHHVFFAPLEPWPATPVDHGYIGINIARDYPEPVASLHDLPALAEDFVTQDPRQSTPGLGFFLTTVGRFGSTGGYTWMQYWTELFAGPDTNATGDEILVVPDWGTAYETYYSGGYGVFTDGHIGSHAIVTSYTESPAAEVYFGTFDDPADRARVLLDGAGSVYHQIQTMGILKGTKNLAVAQAWIEFTLTDDFQELAAPQNAVYPIVDAVSVEAVYQGLDPDPRILPVVEMDWLTVGLNLEDWLETWVALCEARDCI